MDLFNCLNYKSKGIAILGILISFLLIFTFSHRDTQVANYSDLQTNTHLSSSATPYDFNVFATQPEADNSFWISASGNSHIHAKIAPSNGIKASIQTQKVITGLNQFSTYAGSDSNISGKDLDLAYLLVDIPPPASIIFS